MVSTLTCYLSSEWVRRTLVYSAIFCAMVPDNSHTFREQDDVEYDVRSEHPSTSILKKMWKKFSDTLLNNRRIIMKEFTKMKGISQESCKETFTNVFEHGMDSGKIYSEIAIFSTKS